MILLCLKSLYHPHVFLRGQFKAQIITYKILESDPNASQTCVLLSLLLLPHSFMSDTLHFKGHGTRYLFCLKILPLGTHSLSSFTFLFKYHLLWQFYLKVYPPTFLLSFPSLVSPHNKLIV